MLKPSLDLYGEPIIDQPPNDLERMIRVLGRFIRTLRRRR